MARFALALALALASATAWRAPLRRHVGLGHNAAISTRTLPLTTLHAKKKGKKGKAKAKANPSPTTSEGFGSTGTGKGLEGPEMTSATQKEQTLTMDQNDKFAMVYTCGQCINRNIAQIGKVAYNEGLVIVVCQHCGSKHLVADNKNLMDAPEFGKNIEEYLAKNGEGEPQKVSMPAGVSVRTNEDGSLEVISEGAKPEVASEAPKVEEKPEVAIPAADSAEDEPAAVVAAVEPVADEPVEEEPAEPEPEGPKVVEMATKPIDGQMPGTSGLRKKVKVWQEGFFLHNFVQSILDAWEGGTPKKLVLGGDGRYFSSEAIQEIIKICAANGVEELYLGKGGLLSTPAASGVIRRLEADGGIVLTASHNPGGPDEDFGIKFNNKNGAPAPEAFTDNVYKATTKITTVKTMENVPVPDLDTVGTTDIGAMKLHVIESVEDYVTLLKEQFDFGKLKAFAESNPNFKLCFDAMHGAAGPYAKAIFEGELGLANAELLRCDPLPDFGGSHPDPNLFYAADLVEKMGLTGDGTAKAGATGGPDLGAASDGDGDRNMILGKGCFVTPSDSLAVIADWADAAIPGIAKRGGLKTVARSMPSSGAVDAVAAKKGMKCFATPTGWKFFGNLMDADQMGYKEDLTPLLCGEESFGTGSDHVREKDGVWAVVAWLSILAEANDPKTSPFKTELESGEFIGVKQVMERHWQTYGRHLYSRWDFEGVGSDGANAMVERLRGLNAESPELNPAEAEAETEADPMGSFDELLALVFDSEAESEAEEEVAEPEVLKAVNIEDFRYIDPVDGSESAKQGIIVSFEGALSEHLSGPSRAVFRLSGTGSSGATVRLYLEMFDESGYSSSVEKSAPQLLRPLAEAALERAQMKDFTGVEEPTVIT